MYVMGLIVLCMGIIMLGLSGSRRTGVEQGSLLPCAACLYDGVLGDECAPAIIGDCIFCDDYTAAAQPQPRSVPMQRINRLNTATVVSSCGPRLTHAVSHTALSTSNMPPTTNGGPTTGGATGGGAHDPIGITAVDKSDRFDIQSAARHQHSEVLNAPLH
eukprot:Lankesteria_metandrocarpae@DN11249_c0_g1_i1.p1